MSTIALHVSSLFRNWLTNVGAAWERFLFAPADPATLGLIRIMAGAMLFYTHFVWTLELDAFLGPAPWLSTDFVYRFHDSAYGWSHLYSLQHPALLWLCHLGALLVFAALTLGLFSRVAAILAFLLTVSYAHRLTGALFGLDQINAFLAMYLAVGPCGDAFSLDNVIRKRRGRALPGPSISVNVALRLMQVHLCIIYLFAGLGKLYGESWWDGTALWGAFANYEYQTLDMTWMAHSIVLVNVITHVTLIWEVSYAFVIWNRLARPVMLLLAIPLHLGIAFCMGMVTFGVVMLIANFSFVSPALVRGLLEAQQPGSEKSQQASPAAGKRRANRRGHLSLS